MCGIAGIINVGLNPYSGLEQHLKVMNKIQAHRGPDGHDVWMHSSKSVGFAHRRLSIIDIDNGSQPMSDKGGNWIVLNGEIYNYIELRDELGKDNFRTTSDTEVVLYAYRKWGTDCVNHLRGMFSFAVWDEDKKMVFCARDRFGIKPFYYSTVNGNFYFASEAKALLPFLPDVKTNLEGLKDYFVFQFCLDGKTLFDGVNELLPAHTLIIKNGHVDIKRYWEVYYNVDYGHDSVYFKNKVRELLEDSVKYHLRSDVPVGAYISGGVDSSSLAAIAAKSSSGSDFYGFIGKFSSHGVDYDETKYARELAKLNNITLYEQDISSDDFKEHIRKVIYHLDYPVAGPGSFPQYMVSALAAKHRKVVLGGQGGDEVFGGYVRYLVAYFEQCIKGAIEGTLHNGNYVVTYESIIPNLVALQNYKPMLKEFFREGMFEPLDARYYRLVNRAPSMEKEINWNELGSYHPYETFSKIFHADNIRKESYFDSMTHFDFKTLLPALLQVEDRMSMAHGLESRVPLLDHKLVELAATIPADIKFKDGTLKKLYINAVSDTLPDVIKNRKDKMGFPVPLAEWFSSDLKSFVLEIFKVQEEKKRSFFNTKEILKGLETEPKFGRKIWGLLCLELWCQEFLDKKAEYKDLLK